VIEALREMTGGRAPDCCVDACGMESHGTIALLEAHDVTKQALKLETDRGHVVRQMIEACRKDGTIVIMGVYAMFVDRFPLGVAFNKGLHFHMGQMHGPKYIPRLSDCTRGAKSIRVSSSRAASAWMTFRRPMPRSKAARTIA